MPGVDLHLSLPTLSESLASIVAKYNAALSTISDDLLAKVVSSEISINTALQFNGNAAAGLGYLTLSSGSVPSAAGSFYYSGGSFYAIDSTGVVKLTNAGSIAIAGVKGIGGDYGNVANSALVYYDNASQEYRFFGANGTAYGSLVAGSLNLKNAGNYTTTLTSAPSATASFGFVLPSSLPSTLRPLYVGTAGQLYHGADANVSITQMVDAATAAPSSGWNLAAGGGAYTNATASGVLNYPVNVPLGAVITGYKLYVRKTSAAGSLQTKLFSIAGTTGVQTAVTPGTGTEINSLSAPGYVQLSVTGLAVTVASGVSYSVQLVNGANTGDQSFGLEFTYRY